MLWIFNNLSDLEGESSIQTVLRLLKDVNLNNCPDCNQKLKNSGATNTKILIETMPRKSLTGSGLEQMEVVYPCHQKRNSVNILEDPVLKYNESKRYEFVGKQIHTIPKNQVHY